MILKWNKDNINVIPTTPIEGGAYSEKGSVRNKIYLFPGTNGVTAAEYERMIPHVKSLLKNGSLELISKTLKLSGLDHKKAKKAVEECESISTLQYWLENETRADIRIIINDKMSDFKDVPVTDVSKPIKDEEPDEDDLDEESEDFEDDIEDDDETEAEKKARIKAEKKAEKIAKKEAEAKAKKEAEKVAEEVEDDEEEA